MRILLTGYKGYLGSRVLKAIAGHEVVRLDESNFDAFKRAFEPIAGMGFDMILHIGAISDPTESSVRLWQMNVNATQLIVDTFAPMPKAVFISSVSVYSPESDYAYSKLAGESIFESYYTDHEDDLCILRPVSIIGGDQSAKACPSIPDKFRMGQLNPMWSNWVRDYVYVNDVVDRIVRQIDDFESGWYDLGTGDGISNAEIAENNEFFGVADGYVPRTIQHERESIRVASREDFPKDWHPRRLSEDIQRWRITRLPEHRFVSVL